MSKTWKISSIFHALLGWTLFLIFIGPLIGVILLSRQVAQQAQEIQEVRDGTLATIDLIQGLTETVSNLVDSQ